MEYLLNKLSKPCAVHDTLHTTHFNAMHNLVFPTISYGEDWRDSFSFRSAVENKGQEKDLFQRIQHALNFLVHIDHLPIQFFIEKFSGSMYLSKLEKQIPRVVAEAMVCRLDFLYKSYHNYPTDSHRNYIFAHLMNVCSTHVISKQTRLLKTKTIPDENEARMTLFYIKRILSFSSFYPAPEHAVAIASRISGNYGLEWTRAAIDYIYESYNHMVHPKPSLPLTPTLLLYFAKKHQLQTGYTERFSLIDLELWLETSGCITDNIVEVVEVVEVVEAEAGWMENVFDTYSTQRWFYKKAASMIHHKGVNRFFIDQWVTVYDMYNVYNDIPKMMKLIKSNPGTVSWADEEDDDDFFSRPCVFRD